MPRDIRRSRVPVDLGWGAAFLEMRANPSVGFTVADRLHILQVERLEFPGSRILCNALH